MLELIARECKSKLSVALYQPVFGAPLSKMQ